MTNHGAKRPLNWVDPTFAEPITKSSSHAERTEVHHRMGTPITTRGAFHGYPSAYRPNAFVPELSPELVLKALGTPDVPLQQGAPQIPGGGMTGASQPRAMPNSQSNPIGMAPSGIPIYGDPFHPAHKDFGKDDHEAAAAHHERLAAGASSPQETSQHLQAAAAHKQMGNDSQSPMERFAAKFGQAPGGPPQGPMNSTPQGGRTLMPGQPQPNLQGPGAGMPMAQAPKPPGMGMPQTPGQGMGTPGAPPPAGSAGMGAPSPTPQAGGGMPTLAKPAPPPMMGGMLPGQGAMGTGQPPPGQVRPPQMPGPGGMPPSPTGSGSPFGQVPPQQPPQIQPPMRPPQQPPPSMGMGGGQGMGVSPPGMGAPPQPRPQPPMMQPGMGMGGGQQQSPATGLPGMTLPKPPPPAAQPPVASQGQPPMGTPQGQPPMGTQQGGGPGGPPGVPGGSPPGGAPRDPLASLQALLSPDQGKPIMGNPMPLRQGPVPGMTQVQPAAGSNTMQAPQGMPRPQAAGPLSPPTNAGSQSTYVEPTAYKALESFLKLV